MFQCPQFSGDQNNWKDFELEFENWFALRKLPDKYKTLALISGLPLSDQEVYRRRVLQNGHMFPEVISDLRNRIVVDDVYGLRPRWYACCCEGEDSGSFLKWYTK